MNKAAAFLAILTSLLALTGSVVLGARFGTAQERTERTLERINARLAATERRTSSGAPQPVAQQPGAQPPAAPPVANPRPGSAAPQQSLPAAIITAATAPLRQQPANARSPLTSNAMRDVLVTFDRCVLATRTLRCTFAVVNQSPAEKKFVLGIGGRASRFENDHGGATVFDEVGNDFLSAGGSVGNHEWANCDNYSPCELEKVLTSGVQTAGWLRFDAVDPRATQIKLLRFKWSDGDTWVSMDFRNMPIIRETN